MNHEIYKNNEINKFNVCRFVSLNCILLFKYFTKTIMLWWIGAYIVRFVHDTNVKGYNICISLYKAAISNVQV